MSFTGRVLLKSSDVTEIYEERVAGVIQDLDNLLFRPANTDSLHAFIPADAEILVNNIITPVEHLDIAFRQPPEFRRAPPPAPFQPVEYLMLRVQARPGDEKSVVKRLQGKFDVSRSGVRGSVCISGHRPRRYTVQQLPQPHELCIGVGSEVHGVVPPLQRDEITAQGSDAAIEGWLMPAAEIYSRCSFRGERPQRDARKQTQEFAVKSVGQSSLRRGLSLDLAHYDIGFVHDDDCIIAQVLDHRGHTRVSARLRGPREDIRHDRRPGEIPYGAL